VAQSHFDRDTIINDHCCQYLGKPADIACAWGYESRGSRPAWMRRCLVVREKQSDDCRCLPGASCYGGDNGSQMTSWPAVFQHRQGRRLLLSERAGAPG
jgi:hypothetical protein